MRKKEVRWSERAINDLKDIGDYIALREPGAAADFITELMSKIEIATEQYGLGRIVPELGKENIREIIYANYRIVYRVLENEIHVLTVFEGHKLFKP